MNLPKRVYVGAVLCGLVAAVLVVLLAVLFYLVRNAQVGSATRTLLIECTVPPQERKPPVKVSDPKADCYTRAQQQQGSVIGDPPAPINDVAIVAAACGAAHPGDVPATRSCVEKALNEGDTK